MPAQGQADLLDGVRGRELEDDGLLLRQEGLARVQEGGQSARSSCVARRLRSLVAQHFSPPRRRGSTDRITIANASAVRLAPLHVLTATVLDGGIPRVLEEAGKRSADLDEGCLIHEWV